MRVGQLHPLTRMTWREGRDLGHAARKIVAGVRPTLRGGVCTSHARGEEIEDEHENELHDWCPSQIDAACHAKNMLTGLGFAFGTEAGFAVDADVQQQAEA